MDYRYKILRKLVLKSSFFQELSQIEIKREEDDSAVSSTETSGIFHISSLSFAVSKFIQFFVQSNYRKSSSTE